MADTLSEKRIAYLRSFDALTPGQAEELKLLEDYIRWRNEREAAATTAKNETKGPEYASK